MIGLMGLKWNNIPEQLNILSFIKWLSKIKTAALMCYKFP